MIWLAVTIVCSYLFYTIYYKSRKRFRDHNVPYLGFTQGFINIFNIFQGNISISQLSRDNYDAFPKHRYNGAFQFFKPMILIRDPNLVKEIAIKEFDHFVDRQGFFSGSEDDFLAKNLFNMKGNPWKEMRATLSPAFTSSKMRGMYKFINDCSRNFVEFFEEKGEDFIHVDMKEIFSKFANDVIASASFGIQCDSLQNPKSEFYLMGKELTEFSKYTQFKLILFIILPFIPKTFKIPLFPQNVLDFFQRVIKETIKFREEKGVVRPDMIHLLLEARKGRLTHEEHKDSDVGFATVEESNVGKSENKKQIITDVDICGQALIFFFAGFDTTSRAMCYLSMELCKNPDVQRKLQEEIDEVMARTSGTATYEDILGIKYLDQVISEALRMWPPVFQMDRICTKDFVIEPKKPHEKPYLIKKGESVILSTTGIHYDPQFFPNPDTFDPNRFSDENKGKIIPGTYFPFGIGPRNCVGSRFALLEIKVLFFHLLSKFELCFSERTRLPLEMTTVAFNVVPKGGFKFGLKKRNEKNVAK